MAIDFDTFNPIKKVENNSKDKYLEAVRKLPLLRKLYYAYKHAEQENMHNYNALTQEDKDFVRSLINDGNRFYELGQELVSYCDTVIDGKCTYTLDPNYKNMDPFFNVLFNELKNDGSVLYLFAPEIASSKSKLKEDGELMELYRSSFITWCRKKFPVTSEDGDEEIERIYKWSIPFGCIVESYIYPNFGEETKEEIDYRLYDKYMKRVYNSVLKRIKEIKVKYSK